MYSEALGNQKCGNNFRETGFPDFRSWLYHSLAK